MDTSELAHESSGAEAVGVEGARAAVTVGREGDRRSPGVPRRSADAHGWGFNNFSNVYTVMNNDLSAVITGGKSVQSMLSDVRGVDEVG